jgi:hypothetical protein
VSSVCELCGLSIGPDDLAVLAVQRLDITNQDSAVFPEYIDGTLRAWFHAAHWDPGTTRWRELASGRLEDIAPAAGRGG